MPRWPEYKVLAVPVARRGLCAALLHWYASFHRETPAHPQPQPSGREGPSFTKEKLRPGEEHGDPRGKTPLNPKYNGPGHAGPAVQGPTPDVPAGSHPLHRQGRDDASWPAPPPAGQAACSRRGAVLAVPVLRHGTGAGPFLAELLKHLPRRRGKPKADPQHSLRKAGHSVLPLTPAWPPEQLVPGHRWPQKTWVRLSGPLVTHLQAVRSQPHADQGQTGKALPQHPEGVWGMWAVPEAQAHTG